MGLDLRPHEPTRQRRTDASGLSVLPLDECLFLLRSATVGRLAFLHDDEVLVLPVNHHVDGFDIYFRTAPGSKLDAARLGAAATFEVDGHDELTRTGWSVLATGRVEEVTPIEDAHLARARLTPWADGVARDHWLVVRSHRITGRMIRRTEDHAPREQPPAHASRVVAHGDEARLDCTCGWSSRPVADDDPVEWDKAREEFREHVVLAAAARVTT